MRWPRLGRYGLFFSLCSSSFYRICCPSTAAVQSIFKPFVSRASTPVPIFQTGGLLNESISKGNESPSVTNHQSLTHAWEHHVLQGDAADVQDTFLGDQLLLDSVSDLSVHAEDHERLCRWLRGGLLRSSSSIKSDFLGAGRGR